MHEARMHASVRRSGLGWPGGQYKHDAMQQGGSEGYYDWSSFRMTLSSIPLSSLLKLGSLFLLPAHPNSHKTHTVS